MRISKTGYGINRHNTLILTKPTFKLKIKRPNLKIQMQYDTYCNLKNFTTFLKENKFLFITCIWMVIIFLFSNQPALQSSQTSTKVNNLLINFSVFKTIFSIIPIRKCAHFSLYFILAALSYLHFKKYNYSSVISILVCFLYACSDELHQIFINGRSASFIDIVIDTCGACLCILICLFINYLKQKLGK